MITLNIKHSDPLHAIKLKEKDTRCSHILQLQDESLPPSLVSDASKLISKHFETNSIEPSHRVCTQVLVTLWTLLNEKYKSMAVDASSEICQADEKDRLERVRLCRVFREGQKCILKHHMGLCFVALKEFLVSIDGSITNFQSLKKVFISIDFPENRDSVLFKALESYDLDSDTLLSLLLIHEYGIGSKSRWFTFFHEGIYGPESAFVESVMK
jgi:hypothetical protein